MLIIIHDLKIIQADKKVVFPESTRIDCITEQY